MIVTKKYIVSVLKNTFCSPLLLARSIVAGVTGIVREIGYAVKDGYDGERMTLVWVVPIEIFLSMGCFALAPRLLRDVGFNIYHLGALVFWACFIALYSLLNEGFNSREASKDGDTIWVYFGNVVPLFILSVDIIISLILGIVV